MMSFCFSLISSFPPSISLSFSPFPLGSGWGRLLSISEWPGVGFFYHAAKLQNFVDISKVFRMLFSIFSKQFAITMHISTTYTFHLSFRNLSKNSALSLPSFLYYPHYPYSFFLFPCFPCLPCVPCSPYRFSHSFYEYFSVF